MRALRMKWVSFSTAAFCVLLVADVVSADNDKDESGKGRDRYEREYEYEDDDRWEDAERGRHSSYVGNSGWRVGGGWEGRNGGFNAEVWGGSKYPRNRHYKGGHGGCQPGCGYSGYGHRRAYRIPAGHLPPPGACRVWLYDRPAGHQPPPTSCRQAERDAYHHGGEVIYGGVGH